MRGYSHGLLLAAVLVCGCKGEGGGGQDRRSTTTANPWTRFPPMEFIVAKDSTDLTKDQFKLVTQNEADALAKLDASPWVKVSPKQATVYTGHLFDQPGGELVLLRALSLNEATGAFSITWRAGEVRVHHGCLGRHPLPQKRRAIIAHLPGPPTEVYVDCSMAE